MALIKKNAPLVEIFRLKKKKMKESPAKWQRLEVNSSREFYF